MTTHRQVRLRHDGPRASCDPVEESCPVSRIVENGPRNGRPVPRKFSLSIQSLVDDTCAIEESLEQLNEVVA